MVAAMTRHQRKATAGTASGVFALLFALLALFAVEFAFVSSLPSINVVSWPDR